MNKKILLINPMIKFAYKGVNESVIYPPLGLGYLASYLRNTGSFYQIKILDAHILKYDNNRVIEFINDFKPNIIGIQLNLCGENGVELSKLIKSKFPNILVCIGGCIVSSEPIKCLQMSYADIAVFGEGEITFFEICEGINLKSIKGIVYKENNKFIQNPPRPLEKDIDIFPHPAYDLFPNFKNYPTRARKLPAISMITSRGCPFHCTFCNSNISGKSFRSHTPNYIIEEIDLLVNKFGVKEIDIVDDNFTLNMNRAEQILDLIIERKYNIKICLANGVRADRLSEDLVYKMKKAGVFKVSIGVESANKEILSTIKKSLDLNKVLTVTKWFRKYNIVTVGLFMIGFKDDTVETINESIDFALRMNPTQVIFSIVIPLVGTEMYNDLKRENCLIYPDKFFFDTGFHASKRYVKGNLSDKELISLQKKAYFKFNFRIKKIADIVYQIRSISELMWFAKAVIIVFKNIVLQDKG